jgi:hypothetical protein
VLAADKIEFLRTTTTPASGSETGVDARGVPSSGGPYARAWTVTADGSNWKLEVEVSWDDDGTQTVEMHSLRGPTP